MGSVGKGRPKDHNWKKRVYYDKDSDCVYIHGNKMKQMCQALEEKFAKTDSSLTASYVLNAFQSAGILRTDNTKMEHDLRKKDLHAVLFLML